MRVIEFDATSWKTIANFWSALRSALHAPDGYASSIDGMLELMIWDHAHPEMAAWHSQMQIIDPPYAIHILKANSLSKQVADEIELLGNLIAKARREFRAQEGRDIEVSLEILS